MKKVLLFVLIGVLITGSIILIVRSKKEVVSIPTPKEQVKGLGGIPKVDTIVQIPAIVKLNKLQAKLHPLLVHPLLTLSTLSFTPISFGGADIRAYGRSGEEWDGMNTWDNVTYIELPNGTTHGLNYYYRFQWNQFENGTQGSYNWSALDAQIHYAIDHNMMFSFGLMSVCSFCSNMSYPVYLHTLMQAEPTNSKDWVTSAGLNVPNWNSTNYLTRWKAFLNAMATYISTATYSGKNYRDVIYYVDVRGYGDFGEWQNDPYWSSTPTGRVATSASLDSLISYGGKAFDNYPVVIPIGAFDHADASQIPYDVSYYALTYHNSWGHMGWRRDQWGDPNIDNLLLNNPYSYNPGSGSVAFKDLIMATYLDALVVGELSSNQPNPTGNSIYSDIVREVPLYHATSFGNGNYYSNVGNDSLRSNITQASKLCGYRLVLTGGTMTTNLISGSGFNITLNWQNTGVAPVYENYEVRFELRDPSTHVVVFTGSSTFVPKFFEPSGTATPNSDNFTLSTVTPGTYDMYIIIKDPLGYKTPLALGILGRGVDGSYLIRSGITVSASGTPVANAGVDQTITLPTSSVTLDGSSSTGTITSYSWTKISGPNTPTITTPTTVSTTVTGLIAGTYVFQLSLNGGVSTDQIQITVNPAPPTPSTIIVSKFSSHLNIR